MVAYRDLSCCQDMSPWLSGGVWRKPILIDFGIVNFVGVKFCGFEAVQIGVPAGSFASIPADLGLIVIQNAQAEGKVSEVGGGSDFPVPALTMDHGQGCHGCEGMVCC